VHEFGAELALGFKPVADIVPVIPATRDIDLKSTVGDLGMGWALFRQTDLGHYASFRLISCRSFAPLPCSA